ncbi:hypothetical protein Tco_0548364 [Tanacetum coccineum]
MGRDTIQLDNAVSTISQEYILEFTSEYGIPEGLHPMLPGPEDTIVDFPEGKVGMYIKFFELANFRIPISQFLFDIPGYYQIHILQLLVIGAAKVSHFEIACRVLNIAPTLALFSVFYVDEVVFPTVVDWRTSAPKDKMPTADSYLAANVIMLNTRRTLIQKQPEVLLCLVGLSQNYLLGDDEDGPVQPNQRPNPSKVKTGIRPRAAHEVPLLTVIANRVIKMKDLSVASGSSGTPSTVKRSPLDFDNENPAPTVTGGSGAEEQAHDGLAHKEPPKETAATTEVAQEPVVNASPKVLRRDHESGLTRSTTVGKSLASMGLEGGSILSAPASRETPADTIDPDPISYAKPPSAPERDIVQSSKGAAVAGDLDMEPTSPSMVSSPGGIYQPEWGVTNGYRLDTPSSCQELVDHLAPPGYFLELRHLPNEDFLGQYNITLARQVAISSQLRLRFEQEAKLLKKSMAQVA